MLISLAVDRLLRPLANAGYSASVRWRHAVRWATMSRSCGSSMAMCASVASSTPGAVVNAGACTAACTSAAVTRRIRRAARIAPMASDDSRRWAATVGACSHNVQNHGASAAAHNASSAGWTRWHLVAQPVRQSTHIGRQGRLHVHELTQLDQPRIIHLHAMKRPASVRSESANTRASRPIVFRARHRMPIAKSIELFRVHGKHRQALLHQVATNAPRGVSIPTATVVRSSTC